MERCWTARRKAADNSITTGIQTVSRLLGTRGDGTRGLYVDQRCAHTIAEFGSYQYATKEASERNPDEKPLKQNDHAMDAARYCLHTKLGGIKGGAIAYASAGGPAPADEHSANALLHVIQPALRAPEEAAQVDEALGVYEDEPTRQLREQQAYERAQRVENFFNRFRQ